MKSTAARVGWLLAAPLILVNSAASWGQAGWAHDHITTGIAAEAVRWVIAIFFAATLESIGVYLAGMAHAARMADQSAGTLQLGAYGIGALVGSLNYWHFTGNGFRPTAQAVTFGALSAVSPWLWAIYSRYRNRDRLAELGQVDKRGVKLSTSRKFWHPLRSVSVVRYASWEGIVEPDEAVKAWTAARSGRDQKSAPVVAEATMATMVDSAVTSDADLVDMPMSDPLNLAAKLDEPLREIGRWPSQPEPLALVDPWDYSEKADQVGEPGAVERRLSLVPTIDDQIRAIDAADPVFREPERPASDESLLATYDRQLRELYAKGKLNRYQVEQLTGAARRQADRLVEHIEANWEKTS